MFRLSALLVQHGIISLDGLYAMLGPEDKAITEEADKQLAEAKEFVRKMNVVSTSGGDQKDGGKDGKGKKDEPMEIDGEEEKVELSP